MNCDMLAPAYRWVEYARFGRLLERCREAMLAQVAGAKRALVLGDGDGRFLAALADRNPRLEIDAVDSSREMLRLARRRCARPGPGPRATVRFEQGDLRTIALPGCGYDLIASHFVLDCFERDEVAVLARRIAARAQPGAQWIVSEFDLPADGWRRWTAAAWTRIMYRFFRLTTGLTVTSLPPWREALRSAGFRPRATLAFEGGFVVSELWRLEAPG